MANPSLIDGFDKNETNIEAISAQLADDGYQNGEVPKSANFNLMLKQLFPYSRRPSYHAMNLKNYLPKNVQHQ